MFGCHYSTELEQATIICELKSLDKYFFLQIQQIVCPVNWSKQDLSMAETW